MMYGWNGYGWGGGIMMAGMAVFWLLIIVVAFILIRRFSGPGYHGYEPHGNKYRPGYPGHPGYLHDEAMEILRQRYAKGEISGEEFNKMKEMLK